MKQEWIVSSVAMAVGMVGIVYALGQRKKLNDICDKLDTTIEDLSETIDVDIPANIVDAAIHRAVERQVDLHVRMEADSAVRKIRSDISEKSMEISPPK